MNPGDSRISRSCDRSGVFEGGSNTFTSHPEVTTISGVRSILDNIPTSLQQTIKSYAAEQEIPPKFVVELAIAHFLDPDSATFDDCQIGLQR